MRQAVDNDPSSAKKRTRNSVLLIAALLLLVAILHYGPALFPSGIANVTAYVGLTRHTLDRILLLIPITLAGRHLGFGAGFLTATLALILMIPRCLFISETPGDALVESVGVAVTGLVACIWFETERRAKRERLVAASRIEMMRDDLQSNVRLLRSHQKRLAVLNAVSTMLTHALDVAQVLDAALDMVMDVMETEVALVFSLDEEARRLRLVARRGVSDRFASFADGMQIGQGFNGMVAKTGAPLLVEDTSHDPRLTRAAADESIQSLLVVPLKVKGTVTGTLCVANRHPRRFLPEEMELLVAIGNQVGIAIENAGLYQKERSLAAQHQSIFENASDAIWVHDAGGRILAANRALTKLSGYSQGDLASIESERLFNADDLTTLKGIEERMLRNEVQGDTREIRALKKDGTEVIVELTTTLSGLDGRTPGVQHIARDVTESRRMQENLRLYTQAVTKAQEEERNRIARELHDETIQQLIALSHQLEDFAHGNRHLSPDDVRLLDALRQRVKDSLEGVRRFSRDLRPPMLDDLGLISSLEWLTSRSAEGAAPGVEFRIVGDVRRFAPEAELAVFRIVQEALVNVRRHARATKVDLTVEFSEGKTTIIVRDNGRGFEPPGMLGDLSRKGRLGLIGMEERARLLGARLSIQSQPGKGTMVTVEVPM
ncbi:MAG: hypothetical protein A2147_05460 [Chloroflexi bacterium RBG_16_57_8]|nr:MAG: hypothetical protein A2147_05460 [Chloroflexi bacterium RBG_16_57_8]